MTDSLDSINYECFMHFQGCIVFVQSDKSIFNADFETYKRTSITNNIGTKNWESYKYLKKYGVWNIKFRSDESID